MFDEYRIEGKDDRNEIYLEINLDQLNRALKSTLNAHAVKIKLTKKQGACLTIDITQVCITNSGIRLVTQRPEAVASRAKQNEVVDHQLTNQIPDQRYLTILTLP